MATDVVVPEVGESITEVTLLEWLKSDGDPVQKDEPVALMETDKADFELPAPDTGVLQRSKKEGDTISVGESVGQVLSKHESPAAAPPQAQADSSQAEEPAPAAAEESSDGEQAASDEDELSPAVRRIVEQHGVDPSKVEGTGRGGRITKNDVMAYIESSQEKEEAVERVKAETDQAEEIEEKPVPKEPDRFSRFESPEEQESFRTQPQNGVKRVPMSKIRRRIAQRMVNAQQTTASLTTFNEIDISQVFAMRERFRERFDEVHGISLGLMSFFSRACVLALREFPRVNASIEGDDIIYHNYVNLGIAVSTDRGLVVPVLRNVESMSFAEIEIEIKRLAKAARAGKLAIDELAGGTFSITNGGIYGSMLSTPILNPPQSGILGMHAVRRRPVVVEENGEERIEIHPMMYVALTYDHRLIDGRESVTFLVRIKQLIEDPSRMMLEI